MSEPCYRYSAIFPSVTPKVAAMESDYQRGLVDGRKQALQWVADGLKLLAPLVGKGGWAASILLEGFATQVKKYLASGDEPGKAVDE
jgi:hypothetical protein